MFKRATLGTLIGMAGLLMLPAAAAAADKSCWLSDAASPAPSTVYLLCEQGTVFVTRDAGVKFTSVETGAATRLLAMAFLDESRGIAVGDGGTVMATEDGSKTWTKRDLGVKDNLRTLAVVGNNVWIAGFGGLILQSPDGGKTWGKQKSGTTQTIEGLYFLDANNGWGVGWAGTILRTQDGGKNWKEIKTDAASWTLNSVYFKDANTGWVMGFAGQLARSTDGGLTWKTQKACAVPGPKAKPDTCDPISTGLTSMVFDQGNRLWVTADDQFLVSEDGQLFKAVDYDGQLYMRKFLRVGGGLWAVGQLGVLTQANGKEWKPLPSLVVGSAAVMNMAPKEKEGPSN